MPSKWLVSVVGICMVSALEYIVNYERLELAYYDKSLVNDSYFLFRKYNRTNFCLNTSFNLLEDLDGNDMKFSTSAYRFLSNEYKPLGWKLKFNVCEYWKKNIYGTTEHLKKYGNLEGCDIKKGFYYFYNYMPDESQFPKYIPPGIYKAEIDVRWNSGKPLLRFEWHGTATLKIKGREYKGK